ncbi:MAG TPA: hypothetical protein VGX78_01240 [Pirellulales bacterium]|jgi:hypothetical protein|nr:hypothetical protein [Pirellulales bacterium]
MPQTKIAYLGLLDGDRATGSPRGEQHLSALARAVVAASQGDVAVELLSCGPAPQCRSLSPGVVHRVLPWVGQPRTAWDACSWEIADALADADLVHLHDGFSRACEVGLLIAKQWSKPVCLTEFGLTGHWLSVELGLRELADVVICHSPSVAAKLHTGTCVELVSGQVNPHWFGIPAEWPIPTPLPPAASDDERPPEVDYDSLGAELSSIYRPLLAKHREAAA